MNSQYGVMLRVCSITSTAMIHQMKPTTADA